MNRQIAHGLTVAGSTLAATAAIVIADRLRLIDNDTTMRLIMAVIGVTTIWTSNAAPKLTKGYRPELTLAVNRTMVLGGLVFTLAWLVAPMNLAVPLSLGGMLVAIGVVVGLVIGNCVLDKRVS